MRSAATLDGVSMHSSRTGKPSAAQLRRLLRRRIGAAIGQHDKGKRTLRKFGQQFGRARQNLIAAQGAVAQQQRAVQIEHQSLQARRRSGCALLVMLFMRVARAIPPAAGRRSSSFIPALLDGDVVEVVCARRVCG